jgi:hypothetical protein
MLGVQRAILIRIRSVESRCIERANGGVSLILRDPIGSKMAGPVVAVFRTTPARGLPEGGLRVSHIGSTHSA